MGNRQYKGVQKIFSEAAQTYELTNHILTFGLGILWRRKAARVAAENGGAMWLDVCCGTGEMAINLSRMARNNTRIIALDFSLPMLQEVIKKPEAKNIEFRVSSANALPFPDNTFDLVTISFATRNINTNRENLLECFREFHRVLKLGGRFVNLETSQPQLNFLRKLFHLYIRLFVSPVGYLISGSKAAYKYLSYTIPRFFCAEELSDIIRKAGFSKVNSSYMTLGICAIHIATK